MLNISQETFFNVEISVPSLAEQHRIAVCLSSLDELIAAQAQKVEALKTHKKGLMQQLFPREGETQPRLRFPEFHDAGEWVSEALENLTSAKISYGIVQAGPHVSDGMPYIKSTDLNSRLCLANLARTSDTIAQKYRRSEVLPVTWPPETDPAPMRASRPARLGQEKPHETQAPHPGTDHPQAAHR